MMLCRGILKLHWRLQFFGNLPSFLNYGVVLMEHLVLPQGTQVCLMAHSLRNAAPGTYNLLPGACSFNERSLLLARSSGSPGPGVSVTHCTVFYLYLSYLYESCLSYLYLYLSNYFRILKIQDSLDATTLFKEATKD